MRTTRSYDRDGRYRTGQRCAVVAVGGGHGTHIRTGVRCGTNRAEPGQ